MLILRVFKIMGLCILYLVRPSLGKTSSLSSLDDTSDLSISFSFRNTHVNKILLVHIAVHRSSIAQLLL